MNTGLLRHAVATVLTVYGIETFIFSSNELNVLNVATVLTVYGIETDGALFSRIHTLASLQQCLPFTVLKLSLYARINLNF